MRLNASVRSKIHRGQIHRWYCDHCHHYQRCLCLRSMNRHLCFKCFIELRDDLEREYYNTRYKVARDLISLIIAGKPRSYNSGDQSYTDQRKANIERHSPPITSYFFDEER